MAVNIVQIGLGTVENVLSALENIGFTVDSENNTARWPYDTNNKLYFKLASYTNAISIKLYNSSGNGLCDATDLSSLTEEKMAYERIGNTIIFGFHRDGYTGNQLQYAVVEPNDNDDSWLYCVPYRATGTGVNGIIDAATEIKNVYGVVPINSSDVNGIQLARYYDGVRFTSNLFITSVCANIPQYVYNNPSTSVNNYINATVDGDSYLVVNFIGSIGGTVGSNKLAFKRISA